MLNLKQFAYKPLEIYLSRRVKSLRANPIKHQHQIFKKMVRELEKTQFGRDHSITRDTSIEEFQQKIPIRAYEDYSAYLADIYAEKKDILWRGKPKYMTVSSGTTSGQKYIPLYDQLINSHIRNSIVAGLQFCIEKGNFDLIGGRLFYLTGLSQFQEKHGMKCGFLGPLASSKTPFYFAKKRFPPAHINAIPNWDDKLEAIIDAIQGEDIRLFVGTPSWQAKFLKRFYAKTGKKFGDAFPNLKLFVHSGCSFDNYRDEIKELIGTTPDYCTQEMFPASEAFIGFQDEWKDDGRGPADMLLNANSNVFFEFCKVNHGEVDDKRRYTVADITQGETYALVLSTIGGFVGYQIGDNIKITSKHPLRFVFAGRSRFNINFVGEHMDYSALQKIFHTFKNRVPELKIDDFTVVPRYDEHEPTKVRYHWYFDVGHIQNVAASDFSPLLDQLCVEGNAFYKAYFTNGIILPCQITFLKSGSLTEFIKSKSSVGQNKIVNVIQERPAQEQFLHFLKSENLFHEHT